MDEKYSTCSYLSLTPFPCFTPMLFGAALGMAGTIMFAHGSDSVEELIVTLIYPIVSLVVIGIICRCITLYAWKRK